VISFGENNCIFQLDERESLTMTYDDLETLSRELSNIFRPISMVRQEAKWAQERLHLPAQMEQPITNYRG
jgi:hypothetical protein